MGSDQDSNQKSKSLPLKSLSNSDKILYVLLESDKKDNSNKKPLRHSQIVDLVIKFASSTTYEQYITSSRSYYKKYKILLDKGFIIKGANRK